MTAAARQLTLPLAHPESLAADDFLVGPSNAAAFAMIECWPDWPASSLVLLGPEGSGKSHLSSVWRERAGARIIGGRALTLQEVPGALVTGAAVIEDLDPGRFSEPALFHLLNLAREQAAALLLTARTPPSGWPLKVPDLASRLRAIPVTELASPDDAMMRAVLVKLFADRQLAVDEPLVAYVAARIERSLAAARDLVAALDQEALRQKRPVSRALAAILLNPAGASDVDDALLAGTA